MEDNKKYGASILLNDERDMEENNEITVFDEMKDYSAEEIDKARQELINNSANEKIVDKVYVDEMTGIRSSKKVSDDERSENISDIVDRKEKAGKRITEAGIALINDLIDTKPTEEEISGINEFFKSLETIDNIYNYELNDLNTILGSRISDKIKTISEDSDVSQYEAVTKFMIQLYSSYKPIIAFNDDMDELSDILTILKGTAIDDSEKSIDSLIETQQVFAKCLDRLNNLDERNKKLKNEYKVTDFDILAINSIKACLDEAVSFKRIHDYMKTASIKKLRKDISDKNKINKCIENWITDIKNDNETLFTFPVNDYLSIKTQRKELINYFTDIMIMCKIDIENVTIPDDVVDMRDYLLNKGYINEAQIKKYKSSVISFVYVLTRVFKHKKIVTNDDRRILSYTLDMLSKLSIADYRSRLINVISYVAETINGV